MSRLPFFNPAKFSLLRGLLCAVFAALALTRANASSPDSFDPEANGNVYSVAVQPDGKVVIGGSFTTVSPNGETSPIPRHRLARFNIDGSIDASFDPNFDGDVYALAVQPDGKIIVGGKFTSLFPTGTTASVSRSGLARLNADGTVDLSFNAQPTGAPASQAQVYTLALQANGKILIGGGFTAVQINGGSAVTRNHVARINADGTLDTSFDPNANNIVYCFAVQPDGKILLGGGFTQLQPNGSAAVTRTRFARLNADGSIDGSFSVGADNRVLALAVHADGSIVLGGDFLTISDNVNSVTRNHLARVTSGGVIDGRFDPSPSGSVSAIAYEADGYVLIGGTFTSVTPYATITGRRYFARLSPDGAVDPDFTAAPNAQVASIVVQNDGRILIGGYFSRVQASGASGSVQRNRIARLRRDGSLDTAFGAGANGLVSILAKQSDGKFLIAGTFTSIGGATRQNLARLNADGSLDTGFQPTINGGVDCAGVQSDGKIVIGGAFTLVDDTDRQHVARLNADGSLDTSFDPKANGEVTSLFVQSDNKIIISGAFTTLTPNAATTSTTRNYLARLNTDGTVDTGFNPNPNAAVYTIVRQSDGNYLLGGAFTSFGSTTRPYIARMSSSGSIDSFAPTPNAAVYAIAVQSDGKIVFGGGFTAVQPSGATTSTYRNRIARVNSNGTLDTTFDPNSNGNVFTITALGSGNLLVGGTFTTFQPNGVALSTEVNHLALLKSDGTLASGFSLGANDSVHGALALSDTTALIAGAFTALVNSDGTTSLAEAHVAKISTTGSVDTTFRPTSGVSSSAYVSALAPQRDGQILAAGSFNNLNGGTTSNIARFTGSGDVDASFNVSANQAVTSLLVQTGVRSETTRVNTFAWLESTGRFRSSFGFGDVAALSGSVSVAVIQPDGRVLVGGSFTNRNGTTGSNLVRFNTDGTLDTSFNPSPNGAVGVIAIESSGTILIGGSFTTVGGVTRNHLARLNPDGSVDGSYDPNLGDVVNALCLQTDGKLLVGGAFTTVQPNGASASTSRTYLARLNADGTLDTTFTPNPSASVTAIALDGSQIVIGGAFATVTGTNATTATSRAYIARLNADGTVDANYNPTANSTIVSIARQSDGKMVVGGAFTTFQPNSATSATTRYYLARLNTDGSLDTTFDPTPNGQVVEIKIASNNSIYVAGAFTAFRNNETGPVITRNRIARLNSDGSVDTGFNPNADSTVQAIDIAADGSVVIGGMFTRLGPDAAIIVGGNFTQIGGVALPYLARLNQDSNPDSNYQPKPNGAVRALAQHSDGRFYVAGDFTQISGATRNHLARFASDGSLDGGFAPNFNGTVSAVLVQTDGQLLVAGSFSQVNGTSHANLTRLRNDGSVDASYNPSVNGTIDGMALQRDGKLVIGGDFTTVNGAGRARLARLNSDGSLDTSFNPAPDGTVFTVSLQTDGRLMVGGAFQHIAGATKAYLARLNADGSYDSSVASTFDGDVRAIALQDDGHAIVGGSFSAMDGRSRYLVARTAATDTPTLRLSVSADLSQLTLARTGSAPVFSAVTYAYSTNGNSWATLGSATSSSFSDVWTWSGSAGALPGGTVYYVRAIAIESTSQNSSSGLIEYIWQFSGSTGVGPNGPSIGSSGSSDQSSSGTDSNGSGSGTTSGPNGSNGSSTSGSGSSVTIGAEGLANLSTRIQMNPGETVITGFIVSGSSSKRVLVRAVGPTLKQYGITNPLSSPVLELYNGSGTKLLTGVRWDSDPSFGQLFASTGIFPLLGGSADSVAIATLAPGGYTVQVKNADATGGVVLTEIYDLDASSDSHFFNLSARATSSAGENVLIGGFIVQGDTPQTVLIRGMGPALRKYGVTGTLPDPQLKVYDGGGNLIASNDNWSPADVSAVTAQIGATPLETGSNDSALVLTLKPGAYTATVSDVTGASGQGMVEIFEVR